MKQSFQKTSYKHLASIPFLFLLFRIIFFASLPYEIVPGYGDYWNFFHQAEMGTPYLEFWTEFPPLFPFLSRLVYLVSGGRSSGYGYLIAVLMTVIQAINIWLMIQIFRIVRPEGNARLRGWVYLIFTAGLFYTWSYFDTLAVFFMLLGLYFLLTERDVWAAAALILGGLTKWFPLLLLPAVWKLRKSKQALRVSLAVVGALLLVWGALYAFSPDFTQASLVSQLNKGSWETVWALLDGNYGTGNFSPQIDRLNPATAAMGTGNPAVIPAWLTLAVFGAVGLAFLISSQPHEQRWLVDFLGLTLVTFFLWSPGYSPQWVLFLLPVLLLSLREYEGILFGSVLILINLLEWPVLLSRGQFSSLQYLIPLRTSLTVLLGIRFFQLSRGNQVPVRRGIDED